MTKNIFFASALLLLALAACGGNTPARQPTLPSAPRTGSTPAAAPTQQLTPPGLPAAGFPLLESALPGQMVYSNGDGDIYLIEPSPKAQPKKLLGAPNDKGFLQDPQWSPDGQRIVYTYLLPFDASGLPTADVMLANADGSGAQTVIAHQLGGETYATPIFAPDGRAIYVSHTLPIYKEKQIISATITLERFELQTKQVQNVASNGTQAAPSLDGKRLVFIRVDPETFEQSLVTSSADGKNQQVIVPGSLVGGGLNGPRWTPDGKRILFAAPNLFAKRTQPAGIARLLGALFDHILDVRVAEAHGPPWDFWLVDADGKNMQRLTEIGEDEPQAAFSPDGKYFTFLGLAGHYLVDAGGKNVRWLRREGGRGRVDWKP